VLPALAAIVLGLATGVASAPAGAASRLADFLDRFTVDELVPGADRLGAVTGEPPAAPAYRGEELVGYVFLNSDVAESNGYSNKPIDIGIGLDTAGLIVGAKLLEHHEPIVLIGIPEQRVTDFIAAYVGRNQLVAPETDQFGATVDAVSGATVTVLVIDDSITRSATKVARSRQDGATAAGSQAPSQRTVDTAQTGTRDWAALLAEGAVARLQLTVADINDAFERQGGKAAQRRERGRMAQVFCAHMRFHVKRATARTMR